MLLKVTDINKKNCSDTVHNYRVSLQYVLSCGYAENVAKRMLWYREYNNMVFLQCESLYALVSYINKENF
jgi:hypothetical protein